MRILDRYILKSFLVNYLLALCVMVGMYVLLDLIVNVQDFTRGATSAAASTSLPSPTAWDIASDMFDYYFYQLPVIFQQVAGVIPTLAAGFTMVRMTRHHELTAMLSSGVSLYRVATPIILISMGLAGVTVLNQEYLISQPFMIEKLLRKHDEVNQTLTKNEPLLFVKDDSDGSLLSARDYEPRRRVNANVANNQFIRTSGSFTVENVKPGDRFVAEGFRNAANNGNFEVAKVDGNTITVKGATLVSEAATSDSTLIMGGTMKDVFVVYRDASGMPLRHRVAKTAHWEVPPGGGEAVWMLFDAKIEDDAGGQTAIERVAAPAPQVASSSRLKPDQLDLILSKKAVDYLSSARVRELAKYSPEVNRPLLYKIMHLRFTQPLMNIIMLLIGIPFLLTREPNRLIVNMIYCTVVSGVIFVATFVIFQMGGTQLDPMLAAWAPILLFGPTSIIMISSMIQT